jgi:hypothetical protein
MRIILWVLGVNCTDSVRAWATGAGAGAGAGAKAGTGREQTEKKQPFFDFEPRRTGFLRVPRDFHFFQKK